MAEMDTNTSSDYFKLIQNSTKVGGIFMNINRYAKTTTGKNIRLCDFPYDDYWNVLYSEPSFRQDYIHCLITERLDVSLEGNVRGELGSLSKHPNSTRIDHERDESGKHWINALLKRYTLHALKSLLKIIPKNIRKKLINLLGNV